MSRGRHDLFLFISSSSLTYDDDLMNDDGEDCALREYGVAINLALPPAI